MRLPVFLMACACALSAQHNSLTPKESSDGWILLFDGDSTFGWTAEGGAHWNAAGGVLTPSGEPGYLRSNSPFADYTLKLDYRAPAEENSGVFLRSAKEGQPHVTGYELQIFGKHPEFATGSLVNHVKAKPVKAAPDQWHTFEVTASGDHFVVRLDGKAV